MDQKKIRQGVKLILEGIGEDPKRPGIRNTPARVARMYTEVFSGIGHSAEEVVTMLKSTGHDEIVLVRDIPFTSYCEHHMVPFIGKAHVAYLPDGDRITGLSKLARAVEVESRKLQVQERLTTAIAEAVCKRLRPKGVLVILEAEHLCMTMRGIKKPGARTITSVVRGIFRDNPATRAEAMMLIYGRTPST